MTSRERPFPTGERALLHFLASAGQLPTDPPGGLGHPRPQVVVGLVVLGLPLIVPGMMFS